MTTLDDCQILRTVREADHPDLNWLVKPGEVSNTSGVRKFRSGPNGISSGCRSVRVRRMRLRVVAVNDSV
jgi:hypothetical protein